MNFCNYLNIHKNSIETKQIEFYIVQSAHTHTQKHTLAIITEKGHSDHNYCPVSKIEQWRWNCKTFPAYYYLQFDLTILTFISICSNCGICYI